MLQISDNLKEIIGRRISVRAKHLVQGLYYYLPMQLVHTGMSVCFLEGFSHRGIAFAFSQKLCSPKPQGRERLEEPVSSLPDRP